MTTAEAPTFPVFRAGTAPAIEIELYPWEYQLAAQVGAARTAANWNRPDAAHYDRSRMEDDRTAQQAAVAAEIATARAFNRYWTACGAWSNSDHLGYKNLPDVGRNIEVRRIREVNGTDFAFDPKRDRDRALVAAYVKGPEFREVRVLGWIKGEDAVDIGEETDYGRLRVPISALTLRGIDTDQEAA